MQTQITKEWHWFLAMGNFMLMPDFYKRRGSHPMYEPDDHDEKEKPSKPKETRIYKKRVGKYSGSRQLDKDIAVIRGHIEAYLSEGNNFVPPQESYAYFLKLNKLSYSNGKVMSYIGFYQHLRFVRSKIGLETNVQKVRADSIVALFDEGKTIDEIATIHTDSDEGSIRKVLARQGRVYERKTVKKYKHEQVIKLFKEGKSVIEIMAELDSTSKYVKSVLFRKKLLRRKGKYERIS